MTKIIKLMILTIRPKKNCFGQYLNSIECVPISNFTPNRASNTFTVFTFLPSFVSDFQISVFLLDSSP